MFAIVYLYRIFFSQNNCKDKWLFTAFVLYTVNLYIYTVHLIAIADGFFLLSSSQCCQKVVKSY
jgi:hypothetical protein